VPQIREYPEATDLQDTDAFPLDRIGQGSMYIEAQNLLAGTLAPLGSSALVYVIDGNGGLLSTGVRGDLYVPFACTITAVTLLADQTGSVVIGVWKNTYASYPPTSGNSITASAPPTISSGVKSRDTILSGWTTSIAAGDTLRFNVNSVSAITRLTITLSVTKVLA
jgi:hypothetical protein